MLKIRLSLHSANRCAALFLAQECPDLLAWGKSKSLPGSPILPIVVQVIDIDAAVPLERVLRPLVPRFHSGSEWKSGLNRPRFDTLIADLMKLLSVSSLHKVGKSGESGEIVVTLW